MAGPGVTTERLRKDIDRGQAGSKVDYPDPAAAPLGTDDEAAGTPPTQAQVRSAHQQEVTSSPPKQKEQQLDAGAYIYAAIIGVVVAVLCGIVVWVCT
jgi:hypothetical protein